MRDYGGLVRLPCMMPMLPGHMHELRAAMHVGQERARRVHLLAELGGRDITPIFRIEEPL